MHCIDCGDSRSGEIRKIVPVNVYTGIYNLDNCIGVRTH